MDFGGCLEGWVTGMRRPCGPPRDFWGSQVGGAFFVFCEGVAAAKNFLGEDEVDRFVYFWGDDVEDGIWGVEWGMETC
jgi:hypothetical protein